MIIEVMFFILFVGLIIGLPVYLVLGLSSTAAFFVTGEELHLLSLVRQLFSGLNRFNLLAIPMFILAGNIMVASGIMDNLLKVANVLVGWVRGGLAQVNIVASMLFAGISGSAVADTVALGSILIPAMKKEGYDPGFAGAVTASSAIVGPIIPPSNVMIIYGAAFGVPVGHLFAAGFFPGIFVGLAMMVVTYFISIKQGHPKKKSEGWKVFWVAMYRGIIPLLMPLIILGGIFSGVFTATEASSIAVLYALIVGLFIYRRLSLKKLYKLAIDTSKTTGGVMMILGFSQNFGWLLARNKIPEQMLAYILSITDDRVFILILVNVFLFIVGLFIGRTVALLILGPMLVPLLITLGLHPIHTAMVLIFALGVGHLTPPFGMLLYTTAFAGKVEIESILKNVPIYVLLLVVINFIVTFVPEFVMWFPKYIGFLG